VSVRRARVLAMTDNDPEAAPHRYLRAAQEALLWKLDGLPEYGVRHP
jgi:GH43 family beta-xylosidase